MIEPARIVVGDACRQQCTLPLDGRSFKAFEMFERGEQPLFSGEFGSGQVLLKPAPEDTGVIAGGAVRAVMTSAGVQNVLTKSLGTANPHNVIKATFDALVQLRDRAEVASVRGKQVEEL